MSGRPPKSSDSHLVKNEDSSVKMLRLETVAFDKSLGVLYQDTDGKTHKTELQSFDKKMCNAAPVVCNKKSVVR